MFKAVFKVVFCPIKGLLIQGKNAASNQTCAWLTQRRAADPEHNLSHDPHP
jgi:hypothetical protein